MRLEPETGLPGSILGPQELGTAWVERKPNQDAEWVQWYATKLRWQEEKLGG